MGNNYPNNCLYGGNKDTIEKMEKSDKFNQV